jgi:hypothetical protein
LQHEYRRTTALSSGEDPDREDHGFADSGRLVAKGGTGLTRAGRLVGVPQSWLLLCLVAPVDAEGFAAAGRRDPPGAGGLRGPHRPRAERLPLRVVDGDLVKLAVGTLLVVDAIEALVQ